MVLVFLTGDSKHAVGFSSRRKVGHSGVVPGTVRFCSLELGLDKLTVWLVPSSSSSSSTAVSSVMVIFTAGFL